MGCKQTQGYTFDGGESGPSAPFSIMGLAAGPPGSVHNADASSPISRFALGVAVASAAPGATLVLVTRGPARVQLAAALTVAKGQRVWLSGTVAGIGTNVAPAPLTALIGIITDDSGYVADQTVLVFVSPEYAAVP